MIRTFPTDSDHPDFIHLVKFLDAELAERDGKDHGFYSQFNTITSIRHALVAYVDEQPAACGAIKAFDEEAMEVKRMYRMPPFRGKGLAIRVLAELESWAAEMSFRRCVLETGKRQPEAIRLYQKCGYTIIPNYGQYQGVANSVCFSKDLR